MRETQRVAREREYHNQRFADDSERERRTGRFYSAISYGFDLYRRRVSEESKGRRVLEYGCGTGSLAFDLATEARHVIGIDISDVAIHRAKGEARRSGLANVEFRVDNAEAMTLPAQHVDVVAGSGIVHHLDIPKAMQEVRRVLTQDGVAIFAEPLGHNPFVNWYRRRTPELRTPDEHPLTVSDLRAVARGFRSSKVTYFGLVSPAIGVLSARLRNVDSLTRFICRLDRLLCRIPFVRRYAWYCVLEVRQ
ncbi:MAG TPA: class I SAM-dependent methyltransferase [Steroidobacteraceae bacterium]|nr:class I SAM-dependent methyltransferase [Steroidobacteraceae bacterium]